jgi:hypothetical protein
MGNHQDHSLAVFIRNAHKVIKDAISYARFQENNQYYKEILGQKMFEIDIHLMHKLHIFLGADSVVQKS